MPDRPDRYTVTPIEDGWFAVIYIATGKRIACFRRKCDAMRAFNRYYSTYNPKRAA